MKDYSVLMTACCLKALCDADFFDELAEEQGLTDEEMQEFRKHLEEPKKDEIDYELVHKNP